MFLEFTGKPFYLEMPEINLEFENLGKISEILNMFYMYSSEIFIRKELTIMYNKIWIMKFNW